MSDESRNQNKHNESRRDAERGETNEKRDKARPSYLASMLREDSKGNERFHPFGAAFEHRDKKGHTLDTPLGKIMLREPRDRLEETRNDKQKSQRRERGDREDRDW